MAELCLLMLLASMMMLQLGVLSPFRLQGVSDLHVFT
jgi:hypothetical protein